MTLLYRWICYFIIIIEYVVGIECNSNNPCSHQNITCQADQCNLQCNDARSCMNLTFTCNSITACAVYCQQDESCKDIQLYAIGERINIYCSATSACEGAYINATSTIPGGHIKLDCVSEQLDDTRECANLFMDANGQGDVTITCGSVQSTNPQHDACLNTTINCNMQQGECRLSCDYSDDNEIPCIGSKLYCAETAVCRDIKDPYNESNIVTRTPTFMPTIEPRYVLENQHVRYTEAQANCMSQYGAYLATIITEEDLTFANELTNYGEAWIGLGKWDGFTWSWAGGATCNGGVCENDVYWVTGSDSDRCGYLENGRFTASDCGVFSRPYLCNILPMTDYICVDYYDEWSLIMRYNYFYKYAITTNTNDTYQLQWNNTDYTWNFITDNGTQGYCNSNKFILPYHCNEWNGDNMSNIKFTSCPFHSICVVGLHNKTNDITRFDFQDWDYETNGAVYRNLDPTESLEIFRNNNGTHNQFIIWIVFEGSDINNKVIAKCNILTLPSKPAHIISCNQWYFMNNLLDITISFCPTDNPTFGPTVNPITHPTINPPAKTTAKTTEFYTISTTLSTKNITNVIQSTIITTDEISKDTNEYKYEAHESFNSNINHNFQYALISVIIIFSILIVIGYIHSRCISINHFFYLGALFHIAVNFMDLLSDVFFAAQSWVLINFNKPQTQIIFYASCFFIVIPIAFSCYQLYHEMHKHWLEKDTLRAWLAKRTTLLFIMAIITGSAFASIDLFNSNLFSLDTFDMGLSRQEYISFRYKRVYSLVLLENFPQLILQVWYIAATDGYYNIITITSLTFTVISIIVSIISMCVTKQILYDQESIMIEYDVTGQVIVLNRKNANRTWKLNQQLAIILGQNKDIIEIERPHTIAGGVQVHLNIHIIDNNGHQKDDLEQIMQKAISNGQIAETMKNSWNLRGVPMISNMNCWAKSSKRKTKGFSVNSLSNVLDNNQVMQSVQLADVKQSDNNIDEKKNEGQKLIEKQQSIVIEGYNKPVGSHIIHDDNTNDEVKEDENKTLLKGDYDDEDVDNINVNVIGYNNEQRIVNEIDDITNRLTKNADGAISQFDTAGFIE